ncbi:sensor histidine kinase [Photobacterium sp. J15]|uniref:sensor histidine kinase n=1 Tax=Photobacterium sp. J15 TaxID=265901 RepID=UPI0007E4A1A1|nr:HAMP domain-containing sensor histidine kinase [Photobacterium sp. J15]
MSSVSRDLLYRSYVFKALLYFFVCIGVVYTLLVHMVFLSSESFHRSQLERELASETEFFRQLAQRDDKTLVTDLIAKRRSQNSPFSYHTVQLRPELSSPHTYPAALAGGLKAFSNEPLLDGKVFYDHNKQLIIGISPELQQSYRESVMPMLISGALIPAVLMLVCAALFAANINSRLQRVNQAMNRVLCGEKQVKLPVSLNNDEFDILAIHLNFLIEQIEKKESSLKALTVGMAHDMRTPIARMKLRLDALLSEEAGSERQRRHELEACLEDLEVLLGLFNGMLEIARLNSGKTLINKQSVCLTQVCFDVCDFLRPLADEKEQSLVLREDSKYELGGEPGLIFRAVFNLVDNAIKYTPSGGEIEIVVDNFGIVVSDNGDGIPNTEKARVCEPMYRCDQSRTTQGDGLGLALVQAVVKRHGGELVLGDNYPGLRARMMFSGRA